MSITQAQYTTAVFTADRANAALVLMLRNQEALGCSPDWNLAACQDLKIKSGLWSLGMADYSSAASVDIYNQLLDIGSTWFGGIAFDPNAQVPGNTIEIINTPSVPQPVVLTWGDFVTTGSPDGGVNRIEYDNPLWKGFNPFMALTSPMLTGLEVGSDYSLLPTGGFVLLPGGNLPSVVDGQLITVYSYATES